VAVRQKGRRRGGRVLDRLPQRAGPTVAHREHRRERARLGPEDLGDGRGRDHRPRPRLAHERKVVARPEKRAYEDRHRPGPDRAEKGVDVLGTVGKDDEDALLLLDAQPLEHRGHLAHAPPELSVADVDALPVRAKAQRDAGIVATAQDLGSDVEVSGFVGRGHREAARYSSLYRTYWKSIGCWLMPRAGGAIQLAKWPRSSTG